MAFIELNNLSFTYPDAKEPAIQNLTLNVEKGQFVVLFGASGSGKSTLLRLLKKEIQPYGQQTGVIQINGQALQQSKEVGFVFQDPENQVVADDVLHELVFGLENSGLPTTEMRRRVAEMVHYFGAEALLQQKMHELSGGKKQQINLASVLLMQPDILLLDEPTSQLDPVSAREFLDLLVRLNEEFGMTIILAEHRLEEIIALADQLVLMKKGQVVQAGDPRLVLSRLWNSAYQEYIPSIPRLFLKMSATGTLPLSVKEGRNLVGQFIYQQRQENPLQKPKKEPLIQVKNAFFGYDKQKSFVLDELNFTLEKGEVYALMGGNGSGKSTLLKLISGIVMVKHGQVLLTNKPLKSWKNQHVANKIGYLPQNPKLFFLHDTVEKEIEAVMKQWGISTRQEVDTLLERLEISGLIKSHPYDLSGGELQKAALACLLIRKPEILLLDEPTKGLDPISKKNLAMILSELNQMGVTILMSTHDIEFAAQNASKCGMMFQGKITAEEIPERFFNGNFFYTTMIQRLFHHIPNQRFLTAEEAAEQCQPTKKNI